MGPKEFEYFASRIFNTLFPVGAVKISPAIGAVRRRVPIYRRSTRKLMERAALLAIQSECYAEDVPLPEDASGWSDAEVRAYFESGGDEVPLRRPPPPLRSGAVESVAIGGVEHPVGISSCPELVPWVGATAADAAARSAETLGTARWMMVQLLLGQAQPPASQDPCNRAPAPALARTSLP